MRCINRHTLWDRYVHVWTLRKVVNIKHPLTLAWSEVFKASVLFCSIENMYIIQNIGLVGVSFDLLWVFANSLWDRDLCCSEPSTEVLWGGLSRDTLFCSEPAVYLHSHSVETAGTLVNDTEVAVAAQGRGRLTLVVVVVANSILELVNLGVLGLKFTLEMA